MSLQLEERFLAAYDEHADAIFRFCYAQTGQRDLALDLMQDTFVRAWKHLQRGRSVRLMRPFLYSTARNALIDYSRKAVAQSLDSMHEEGFEIADAHAIDPLLAATNQHVIGMVQQLDPMYRDVVSMRFLDELMPREIAVITGEKESVISTRITRGLEQLRVLLHV
ncbi:MAG: RNA polymerase sigma factor [Candidatus Pacebacteria bacterium]|nr:RNA polymerase sigma factor [Candidatus Paceibacterota bacterium]